MGEQHLDAGAVRLCYEVLGEECNPTVVLIMGLNLQMVWWSDDLVQLLLDRDLRVVRFDNRDTGLSSTLPGQGISVMQFLRRKAQAGYSLADMADDTAALIDHVAPHGAHVVGASLGSFVAQETAIRHPSKVLTLTSIMGRTGDRRNGKVAWSMRAGFLRRTPASLGAQQEQMVQVFRKMGSTGRSPQDDDDVRVALRRSHARNPGGGSGQMAAVLNERDRTADLQALTLPALVIHGDRDKVVLPSGGCATADAVAGSELMIVAGMGHDLPRRLWPQLVDGIARTVQRSVSA